MGGFTHQSCRIIDGITSPGAHTEFFILLVLTLSLSAFTASLASTLDDHLVDNQFYQAGADIHFKEMGEGNQQGGFAALMGGADETSNEEEDTGPRWYFRPVTEYQNTPGVEVATRVGRYEATANVTGGKRTGVFMGLEPLSVSGVRILPKTASVD